MTRPASFSCPPLPRRARPIIGPFTRPVARRLTRFGEALGLILALGAATPLVQAADLTVQVETANTEGKVMLAVYHSAADFRERPAFTQSRDASPSPLRFRFDSLPAGDYAVAIFQDLNGNGKLDTNLVGMPREPFGFSQEPKGLMGPPGWEQVKFAVPAEGTTIHVRLGQ